MCDHHVCAMTEPEEKVRTGDRHGCEPYQVLLTTKSSLQAGKLGLTSNSTTLTLDPGEGFLFLPIPTKIKCNSTSQPFPTVEGWDMLMPQPSLTPPLSLVHDSLSTEDSA